MIVKECGKDVSCILKDIKKDYGELFEVEKPDMEDCDPEEDVLG